ncbi:MAG: hypothetical protein FWH03_01210 [Firmicutes bacterium]|nr:hypothetical protein [Bacillota bacterium]
MQEIHNTFSFSVRAGVKKTVKNSVTVSAPHMLGDASPYARYVRIHTDTEVVEFETQRTSTNTNHARGPLTATYSVVLSKSDLAGQTIIGFGLSNGTTQVNYAEIKPYTKTASQELTVTAQVFLEVSLQGCSLIASDNNPLVLGLLGAKSFMLSWLDAQWGECNVNGNYGITDTVHNTDKPVSVGKAYISGGLRLTLEVPSEARDAVLFLQNTPFLRVAVNSFKRRSYVISKSVSGEQTVGEEQPLYSCGSAAQGAQQFTQVQILNAPWRVIKCSEPILINYDRDLKLITDPSFTCAAFVSDKELFLIGEKSGRLSTLARLETQGRAAHLPEKNEIVLIGANSFDAYRYTPEEGVVHIGGFAFDGASADLTCAIVKRNNQYVILRSCGTHAQHWTANASVTQNSLHSTINEVPRRIFRNRYLCTLLTDTATYCFGDAFNSGGASSVAAALQTFRTLHAPISIGDAFDGSIHFFKPEQPAFSYVYSPYSDLAYQHVTNSQVKIFGEYYLVINPFERNLFYFIRDASRVRRVPIDDANTVAEVARVGELLLVRRENGTLEEYAIEPYRSDLFHPHFVAGQNLSATAIGLDQIQARPRKKTITILDY